MDRGDPESNDPFQDPVRAIEITGRIVLGLAIASLLGIVIFHIM